MNCHEGSWTVINCHEKIWIVINCLKLVLPVINHHKPSQTNMSLQELSGTLMNLCESSLTIMICHELSWAIRNCHESLEYIYWKQKRSFILDNCEPLHWGACWLNCESHIYKLGVLMSSFQSMTMLSISRNVHMFVCLCVCLLTFEVPFNGLFAPHFLKSDVQYF